MLYRQTSIQGEYQLLLFVIVTTDFQNIYIFFHRNLIRFLHLKGKSLEIDHLIFFRIFVKQIHLEKLVTVASKQMVNFVRDNQLIN